MRFRASWICICLGAGLCGACATREVPSAFSDRAAASPSSAPGATAEVGVALREDPPLQPQAQKGWVGLAPAGGGMSGHEHHHHHGAPADTASPSAAPAPTPAPSPTETGHVH